MPVCVGELGAMDARTRHLADDYPVQFLEGVCLENMLHIAEQRLEGNEFHVPVIMLHQMRQAFDSSIGVIDCSAEPRIRWEMKIVIAGRVFRQKLEGVLGAFLDDIENLVDDAIRYPFAE